MNEIFFINTFFNIVYRNESAYMRDLLMSYDYIQSFVQWLCQRHISCDVLSSITRDDYALLSRFMKAEDVDHILHKPFSSEMETMAQTYQEAIHIVYVPGFDESSFQMTSFPEYENIYFYTISEHFQRDNLSFFDPFPAFFCALNHADMWPGCLIFKGQQTVFAPIHNQKDFLQLTSYIENQVCLFDVYNQYQDDAYFIQLSDLHLGKDKRQKGLERLYASLDELIPRLPSLWAVNILITGDLMESPNRKNMYLANDFMNSLKKRYKANVTFILGNHDVIVHGFNFARNQKSKVIAYLLGENVKVLEQEKIVIIKMDTTSEGNLARGKVGKRQLDEIDDELSAIDHLEEYTLLVMLHHHVYPINKAEFIKTKWHEKTFINRIIETSKVLVDAPLLIDWLKKRHIHYVFHGHKHLPFFKKEDDCYHIGAGSATGGLKESRSRYISYNVMKYNIHEQKMKICMIFYDDKAKAERQRVEVYLFEGGNNHEISRSHER